MHVIALQAQSPPPKKKKKKHRADMGHSITENTVNPASQSPFFKKQYPKPHIYRTCSVLWVIARYGMVCQYNADYCMCVHIFLFTTCIHTRFTSQTKATTHGTNPPLIPPFQGLY